MKIEGLISENITPLIEASLDQIRTDGDIPPQAYSKLMDEKAEEVFQILEDTFADFLVTKYSVKEFRKQYGIARQNSKKIVDLHEDFFRYLIAYIHTAHIVYSNFLTRLQTAKMEASDLELKDQVHLLFYGNLCRMVDQIAIELLHGYADAALRLWRSFYEHCVVAVFLMMHNSNELAHRFRDVTYRENKRSVESYAKHHHNLKFPHLTDEIISRVQKEFEEAKTQYSKAFFENDYSWAQPFINGKANFLSVEEAAGFDRFRPFYIWASSKVHPTYKVISDFKDSRDKTVLKYITIPDADRRSLVDPAQLTLACLHEVNNYFLHLYSGHEYTINQLVFRKMYDQFAESISESKVDSKK